MEIIKLFNMNNKICRICLESDDHQNLLISMFSSCCDDEYSNTILSPIEMLNFCSSIKITDDDGMPTTICNNCIYRLTITYNFLQQCETSDIRLKQYLQLDDELILNHEQQPEQNQQESDQSHQPLASMVNDKNPDVMTIKPLILHNEIDKQQIVKSEEMYNDAMNVVCELFGNVPQQQQQQSNEHPQHQHLIVNPNNANRCNNSSENLILINTTTDDKMNNVNSTTTFLITNGKVESAITNTIPTTDAAAAAATNMNNFVLVNVDNHQTEDDHVLLQPSSNDLCVNNPNDNNKKLNHPETQIKLTKQQTKCINNKSMSIKGLEQHHPVPPHAVIPLSTNKNILRFQPLKSKADLDHYLAQHTFNKRKKSKLNQQQKSTNSNNDEVNDDQGLEEANVTKTSINNHRKKRERLQKPDECRHCGKTFNYTGYLAAHMRTHNGERPFQCELCELKFTQAGNLALHMRVHTGERPYQCEICSKLFTTSSNLKAHQRIHSEQRDFPCRHCTKAFKSMTELQSHEGTHTGIKNHICTMCGKAFYKIAYLNVHIRTVHIGEKKHQCTECDKVFSNSSNLTCHFRIHTGEKPYSCKICLAKFNQSSALIRHTKQHSLATG